MRGSSLEVNLLAFTQKSDIRLTVNLEKHIETKRTNYRVTISYKGSHYFGWQDLGSASDKPTVQFEVLQVLRKICNYGDCVVSGASRTDAGVHALGQVAKLSIPKAIAPDKLLLGMNSLLAHDIRIVTCQHCSSNFNPSTQSTSKIYRYYFSLTEPSSPLLDDIVTPVSLKTQSQSATALALKNIEQASKLFVGEHDFYSFAVNDKSVKTTRRNILRLKLHQTNLSDFGQSLYYFEIEGNGFLRHMIRYMVGALFEVGKGTLASTDIVTALDCQQDSKLCPKAKARGLQLVKINY